MTAPNGSPSPAELFAQHKTAVLGAAAAGVVGLALLQRKKSTKAPAGPGVAGTIPAAAVVPSSGVQGAYPDTSSQQVYDALEGQLERLQAGQAKPVPTPVASALFAPQGTGNYALYSNGTVAEIESDGSQLGLSQGQWDPLRAAGAKPTVTLPGASSGAFYTTAGNLAAKPTP